MKGYLGDPEAVGRVRGNAKTRRVILLRDIFLTHTTDCIWVSEYEERKLTSNLWLRGSSTFFKKVVHLGVRREGGREGGATSNPAREFKFAVKENK